jgi:glycosyltransferase involved in cell wall biosynthesis
VTVAQVLFHRDFDRFRGGHLKVWDYFNHVDASPCHRATIKLSSRSSFDPTNPWRNARDRVVESTDADVYFLAGLDWMHVEPRRRGAPVLNLVQHLRHADPDNPRFAFLRERAVRICVSPEVAAAIEATGQVNGPVFTVPNSIDLDVLPASIPRVERALDLLVLSPKQPQRALTRDVAARLDRADRRVLVLTERVPRARLLDHLADARVLLVLPNRREGFCLPALEGMAMGPVVVCPDCVGNRSFCLPGETCFRPDYELDAIVADVEAALRLGDDEADAITARARATAEAHDIRDERARFLEILARLDELWAGG